MNKSSQQSGSRQRPQGFTIIELMVVVSLIALFLGFSVPLVFKIDELTRDRSGVNSFGVAVSAARAYATRPIADRDDVAGAEYSGAAVIVTPYNELRIVEDVQNTQNAALEAAGRSEYRDVPTMEMVTMPRGMGVMGISRVDSTSVRLLAPPFAIRFNKHGQLVAQGDVATTNADVWRDLVYYDGDYNGAVNTGSNRYATAFTPSTYDPDVSNVSGQFNTTRNQYKLPIETLDCVVGVVVYSKADFEDAGGVLNSTGGGTNPSLGCKDGTCNSIAEWMFDNGSILFFSRNTGTIVRTKRQ